MQRELRAVTGVTAIIYDQTCAAEKRRRRKRGKFATPASAWSSTNRLRGLRRLLGANCLSVEPVETEFGRKRRIDQTPATRTTCA